MSHLWSTAITPVKRSLSTLNRFARSLCFSLSLSVSLCGGIARRVAPVERTSTVHTKGNNRGRAKQSMPLYIRVYERVRGVGALN